MLSILRTLALASWWVMPAHAAPLEAVDPLHAPWDLPPVDAREAAVAPEESLDDGDDVEVVRPVRLPRAAEEGRWRGFVGIGTDLPLEIGGQFLVETPVRLRLYLGLGGMPRAYQQATQDVVVAVGGYDAATAEIVQSTLQSAFVLTTGLGWRPAKRRGFVMRAGYRMLRVGGENTGAAVLANVPGVRIPEAYTQASQTVLQLQSTLHQLSVELGWEWIVKDHLLIRFDVGGSFTLASDHVLSAPDGFEAPQASDQWVATATAWLDELLRTYGHAPTVGLAVGYRF